METTILTADATFERLTTEFLGALYAAHPVLATAMGVHCHDDQLDSFNRFALRDLRDLTRSYLHAIDHLSLAELSPANRIDCRLARSEAQMRLVAYERQRWHETQPDAYLQTLFTGLGTLVMRRYAEPEVRAVGLLGRLRALPTALADAKQNLQKPPRLFTETALESAEAGDALFSETLPAFSQTLASAGLRRALEEANMAARSAVQEYARFLRETILPRSEGDFALGKELYEYHLRVGHLLSDDSEALEALGREILERTKWELAALSERIAPGSDWQDLVAALQRIHPPDGESLVAYAKEIRRALAFVRERELCTLPQNEALLISETPRYARPFHPSVAYSPPAPFETRHEGVLWVTPMEALDSPERPAQPLQGRSLYQIPLLALHEAYPGRHLQSSVACQHPSRIRRHFAQSRLFCEGWAFYCEEMMWEQGFYADPRIRLMQLQATLWRACRVLLDVRLHTHQRSPAEAVQFLCAETQIDEAHAWAEVKRYAQAPTHAMTFLVGKQALLALREEMQKRQGSRFSLRQFHDLLLMQGSLPPALFRDLLFSVP